MSRTDDLLSFMRETEKLKLVYRQIWLSDESRQESDAEHSWHLALFIMLFEKELGGRVDVARALRMALVHDIVEAKTGDVYAFDEKAKKGKAARELAAAKELFGALPSDVGEDFLSLFLEFEAKQTPEAKAVQAFDKLHPLLMNLVSNGYAWKVHGITYDQVDAYKRGLMECDPSLLVIYEQLMAEAKERGLLK